MSTTIDSLKEVRWPLAVSLGVLALVRPVLNIFGVMDDVKPLGPIVVTALITVVWVAAVLLARDPNPVRTLVITGLVYGVLAIALSGIVSPIKDGELQGPLTNPIAVPAVLVVNAVWGLVAGLVAAGLSARLRRD